MGRAGFPAMSPNGAKMALGQPTGRNRFRRHTRVVQPACMLPLLAEKNRGDLGCFSLLKNGGGGGLKAWIPCDLPKCYQNWYLVGPIDFSNMRSEQRAKMFPFWPRTNLVD